MSHNYFNLDNTHQSWKPLIKTALKQMDCDYLTNLNQQDNWLPGSDKIFSAFSLPINKTNYILLGESPYPRAVSANGYAFWDEAVEEVWSATGLSKSVNRATSLRNIIKMLLVAEKLLLPNQTSQTNIAAINKKNLIQTNTELFNNILKNGFLLINATPVFRADMVKQDAAAWRPFLSYLLTNLISKKPNIKFILLGKIAEILNSIIKPLNCQTLVAEHPYNLSFIQNSEILDFFRPFKLLSK